MKKICTFVALLAVIFLFTGTINATGLLTENFNYNGTLIANGWGAFSGAGTNTPTTVGQTGLTYTGYAGSAIGQSALVSNNGEDDSLTLTGVSSGDFYVSYM